MARSVSGLLPLATAVAGAWLAHERPSRLFWACAIAGSAVVVAFALWQGGGAPHPADGLLVVAVAAAALAAGVLAFVVHGVEVPGEFLRAPIERALTAAFGMPARIEGPIRLRTGLAARVSADALVFDDPSGPAGATLARGIRPGAQIDLVALLRRVVTLEEVTGERLELTLVRRAGGQANWAPVSRSAS